MFDGITTTIHGWNGYHILEHLVIITLEHSFGQQTINAMEPFCLRSWRLKYSTVITNGFVNGSENEVFHFVFDWNLLSKNFC